MPKKAWCVKLSCFLICWHAWCWYLCLSPWGEGEFLTFSYKPCRCRQIPRRFRQALLSLKTNQPLMAEHAAQSKVWKGKRLQEQVLSLASSCTGSKWLVGFGGTDWRFPLILLFLKKKLSSFHQSYLGESKGKAFWLISALLNSSSFAERKGPETQDCLYDVNSDMWHSAMFKSSLILKK